MPKDDKKIVSLADRGKNKKAKEEKDNSQKSQSEQIVRKEPVFCSFCNRPNTEVLKMVQGPGVNICSECTMIAVQYLILNDRMPSQEAQKILDMFWRNV